jgi:fused signal recognition particle receptor
VIFVVGVNGVGKTTTIGKLAARFRAGGESTLIVAADTFRAAAVGQLKTWADRAGAAFHESREGQDPASVVTDGLRKARAAGTNKVLVDTAGRLQNKSHLMAELSKMGRIAARECEGAPHETLLVLDATTGSNGLAQAQEFARAIPLTGLVLTKLDGTAKGGIAVAIVSAMKVPIRFVGLGEGLSDLAPFDARSFAESLLD